MFFWLSTFCEFNYCFLINLCIRAKIQQYCNLQRDQGRSGVEIRILEVCIGKKRDESRSKTEYLCINGGNDDETVKMEDTKVPRVKEFKYLGSTVQENGGCEREVKKRVQAGWNGWRRVSGVICDKRLPARVKGKVYSSVVRPAMVYGLETVAVTKKQVEELEVAEMKMLRFAIGVTRKDKIRNEHIRSTVKVEQLGMKMREGRLRWYGHVMRRDQEYVGRKMIKMELPGKRRRGRPKRRFLDVVKEDMKEVGVKEMDIENRKMWRMMIRCGHQYEIQTLMGKAERRRRFHFDESKTNFS